MFRVSDGEYFDAVFGWLGSIYVESGALQDTLKIW
jgi:hypothetical protein